MSRALTIAPATHALIAQAASVEGLTSWPWLDPESVMPVLEGKATQSASSRNMTLDEWIATLGGEGLAGVSPRDMALRVGTVFACVRVIAEDVGKLPRHLLRRTEEEGRQRTRRATDDPRYVLLTQAPNDWMTAQELYEYMVGQAALRGAAYARLVRARGGEGPVTEILPLLPGTCRREQDHRWGISYRITGYGAGEEIVGSREIWCLNGPMLSPLAGADVSAAARGAIDLASAIEAGQTRFHAGDARPSGLLTTKATIKPETRDAIRVAWQSAYGPGGRGGVAVLDSDFEFEPLMFNAVDSQVIENRQFQIEEICRFFRVHPWAVMRQASTQAYASIEQTALAHIQHTIMPWVTRVEQTVQRDILGPGDLYLKINLNALARATLKERVDSYAVATKVFMTPNEVRALEDMDEIDDPELDAVQLQRNNTGAAPAKPPAGKA